MLVQYLKYTYNLLYIHEQIRIYTANIYTANFLSNQLRFIMAAWSYAF